MRIAGGDTTIIIEPVRYEFAETVGDRWDDNWLVVAGDVSSPEGSWSFEEPCLTTFEAREVGPWFRAAADDRVEPAPAESVGTNEDRSSPSGLWFVEPNLAFSVEDRLDDVIWLRVHFSLEALPQWLAGDEGPNLWGFYRRVPISADALCELADGWDAELRAFAER